VGQAICSWTSALNIPICVKVHYPIAKMGKSTREVIIVFIKYVAKRVDYIITLQKELLKKY